MHLPWEKRIISIIWWLRFSIASPSPRGRQDLASPIECAPCPCLSLKQHSTTILYIYREHDDSEFIKVAPADRFFLPLHGTPSSETLLTTTSRGLSLTVRSRAASDVGSFVLGDRWLPRLQFQVGCPHKIFVVWANQGRCVKNALKGIWRSPQRRFWLPRPRLPFSESLYVVALEDGLYQWRSADVVDVTLHWLLGYYFCCRNFDSPNISVSTLKCSHARSTPNVTSQRLIDNHPKSDAYLFTLKWSPP